MIGKKIIEQKNIPLYEIKEVLAERNKEGELRYEQQAAFDYSKKFAKVTPAKGEKLFKDLQAIEGLDDEYIVKAIDLLPMDLETARLINPKGDISEEKLKEIVELTSKQAK
ncbi:MAG TPA: DNA-directed RNA polymerase subunit F [archaeon]|nr:DNA-directed RNA polymerase subunit F [archaeon]